MSHNDKLSLRLPRGLKRQIVRDARARKLKPAAIVREILQKHLLPEMAALEAGR